MQETGDEVPLTGPSKGRGSMAAMPTLRVNAFAVSLDGYGAGPDQGLENPLGRGGTALHDWCYPTRRRTTFPSSSSRTTRGRRSR